MTTKFLVGYDGSDESKRALDFAIERAGLVNASLTIAYVLEWSPYSFLTPEEIEQRHTRRKEEIARAEEAVIAPLMASLGDKVKIDTVIKYGNIADTLISTATEIGAAQIILGRKGSSGITSRMFGSTAGNLVQSSPVPCTIVP